MSLSDTPARFTLRQLPVAAKLVVTVFLLAVGLGYLTALVQVHNKDTEKDGSPMPTPARLIEIFSGLKEADPNAVPPFSRMDKLLDGDRTAPDVSHDNMAPAFFAKSKDWGKTALGPRGRQPIAVEDLREGERLAMLAWVRLSDATAKKAAYENDRFPLPDALIDRPISGAFVTPAKEVKIKSLIDIRCQHCHKNQEPSLHDYAALQPWVTPPSTELIDGKWVRSSNQKSVNGLTTSTHAHLLSFATLFGLTGLVFAFTSYPLLLRCFLGPVVLVAMMCDIACWWLARIDAPYGPMFALAVLGTGGTAAVGLVSQIVLSLLNMYAGKGKVFMLLVMAVLGGGLAVVGLKVIQPALDAEKSRVVAEKAEAAKIIKATGAKPVDPPAPTVSHLERLIMGPTDTKVAPFNGKGSMGAAFFDKDGGDYKAILKDDPTKKPELDAKREGERLAVQAWLRAEPDARKKSYEAKKFDLPPALVGKPLTERFALDGGKAANVHAILTQRCARCHSAGEEQAGNPLETYEQLMKYVEPPKAAAAVIPPAKE